MRGREERFWSATRMELVAADIDNERSPAVLSRREPSFGIDSVERLDAAVGERSIGVGSITDEDGEGLVTDVRNDNVTAVSTCRGDSCSCY